MSFIGQILGGPPDLYAGCHPTGKDKAQRKQRRKHERRLLKQAQQPKQTQPTKGFK